MIVRKLVVQWVVITSCSTATPEATPLPPPISRQDASLACPVTTPRRVENVRGGITFAPSYVIGSDKLWTNVSSDNIVLAQPWLLQADGSIRVKWACLYRAQVEGELKVVGQRISEGNESFPEVELAQDINPADFPELEDGIEGRVSYMVFPSTGCWNVTATKGAEQIQFTTQVVEVDP